jgi:hypothetical protein
VICALDILRVHSDSGLLISRSNMAKRSVAHYLCCRPPIGVAGLERGVISEHKLVLMSSLSIWGVLARFWRVLVQGIGQVYVKQVMARFPLTMLLGENDETRPCQFNYLCWKIYKQLRSNSGSVLSAERWQWQKVSQPPWVLAELRLCMLYFFCTRRLSILRKGGGTFDAISLDHVFTMRDLQEGGASTGKDVWPMKSCE